MRKILNSVKGVFKKVFNLIKKCFSIVKALLKYLLSWLVFSYDVFAIIVILTAALASLFVGAGYSVVFILNKMEELKPFGWSGYIYPLSALFSFIGILYAGYKSFKELSQTRTNAIKDLLDAVSNYNLENKKECNEKLNSVATIILRYNNKSYKEYYRKLTNQTFTYDDFLNLKTLLEKEAIRYGSIKGFIEQLFEESFQKDGKIHFQNMQNNKIALLNHFKNTGLQ